MSDYVSKRLRAIIARRANGRCEYCGTPIKFSIDPFVAEHIHPIAKGGLTDADNLAYACMGCNGYKQDKIEAYDALSQTIVSSTGAGRASPATPLILMLRSRAILTDLVNRNGRATRRDGMNSVAL